MLLCIDTRDHVVPHVQNALYFWQKVRARTLAHFIM